MRAYILLLAIAAFASADKLEEPSTAERIVSSPPAEALPVAAPVPAHVPSAIEHPAPIADAHQHYTPAGDNGYYYYYYPVEEPAKTNVLLDYLPAWSWMTWLVVSMAVVGLVLLAPAIVNTIGINAIIASLGLPDAARNFNPMDVNYGEVLEFATNVYKAVNKEY